MTRMDCETLVEFTLNVGQRMMECGAEAWRTEDTMARIVRAYGLEALDTHTIATQVAMTVKAPDGTRYTSTCSIPATKTRTDLGRLEELNAAARQICKNPPAIADLPSCTEDAGGPISWSWRELLGYLLGAGAFAVFFGGGVLDGIASAGIGGLIYAMDHIRYLRRRNRIIYTVIACFLAGMLARLSTCLGLGINLDKIMIGDVMLFIPGLALVNGVREMFYADILTGLYRLVEVVLAAAAIAAGFAVSLMLGGGVL